MDLYDYIVIGAGVTGATIARELSRFKVKTLFLDRENDVSCGASKANTAIVHGGLMTCTALKKQALQAVQPVV